MRSERIVKRQSLKQQLADLQSFIKASKPLVEADKTLRRAYMEGFKNGLQQGTQALNQAKTENALEGGSTKDTLEPGDNTQDQGSAQAQEETPVGTVPSNDIMHL